MSADISELIEQIREAAEKATPGSWSFDGNCGGYITDHDARIIRAYAADDASYVEAVQPSNVRSLLDRIANLEADLAEARRQRGDLGRAWDSADARAKEAEAERDALRAALAKAHQALEPFAELGADEGHEDHPDETPAVIKVGRVTDFSFSLSDFRRAARALSGKAPKSEDKP